MKTAAKHCSAEQVATAIRILELTSPPTSVPITPELMAAANATLIEHLGGTVPTPPSA